MKCIRRFILFSTAILAAFPALAAPVIHPGAIWLDNRGKMIQAHGGGVIRWNHTYYWFGQDFSLSNDSEKRYVACYSSRDLVHWAYRGQVFKLSDPAHLGRGWVLERPKVYYDAHTGKFVLYAHLDNSHYTLAQVAVAVSDRIDGEYNYVRSFRPLGKESRDIGQFIDDDGQAYLIFESRPTKGFFIAKLSADYLDVTEMVSFVDAPLEGGALVRDRGVYYVLGSHMTDWRPNPNVYATARSLHGPWSKFKDIAPPATNTYGAQSTMLLKLIGSKQTTVIFMGDIWRSARLWDSRYLWMPLEINDQEIHLPPPSPWTLDVKTGETRIIGAASAVSKQPK